METLKDIFVSYEIAVKLEEVGFECECIAYQWYSDLEKGRNHLNPATNDNLDNMRFNPIDYSNPNILPRPTYEQVKKWFREKGVESSLFTEDGYYYYRGSKGDKFLFSGTEDTYEQAREQLILKLIEIYKNEQNI